MEYLPEVTQYLRKAALLATLGWSPVRPYLSGASTGTSAEETTPPPAADTRMLPLQLSRLTRLHKCRGG